MNFKACRKCGETKGADAFSKNPRIKSGLSSWCKACVAKSNRERYASDPLRREQKRIKEYAWRKENIDGWRKYSRLQRVRSKAAQKGIDPEQAIRDYESRKQHRAEIINNPPTEKKCTKCSVVKPRDKFPSSKRTLTGMESACKVCKQQSVKVWAQRNSDRLAAYARKRYATSPKERQQSLNRTKVYKARKKGCEVRDLTAHQWVAIKLAYGHRCAYCNQKKPLTQDHVIPISKGGQHTASNIVPACMSCNSSKGAREPQVAFQPHLVC